MMGNRKTVFKYFTIPQYRQEENYLSAMSEKGFSLVYVIFSGQNYCHQRKKGIPADHPNTGNLSESLYFKPFLGLLFI